MRGAIRAAGLGHWPSAPMMMTKGHSKAEETVSGPAGGGRSIGWRLTVLVAQLLAVATMMLVLPAYASGAWTSQPGPFPVGNLLSYANSDFEGQVNFTASSNATISDSSTGFLHSDSLQDSVGKAGTSVFKLQKGVAIGVSGGSTYTLSAYVMLSSASSGQTLTFGLNCYSSPGHSLGWSYTPSLALVGEQTWQYVEGQVTVPSACTNVVASPKVTLSGMANGEAVNVDELTFRPYRAALVMGAHGNTADDGNTAAYTATDWLDTNLLLGPLQSDKFFFTPTKALPSSWSSSSNNCYEIEQALPSSPWPECVIAYKVQETEAQLQSFLAGLPADQQVIMVWWQEPENNSFSGCPGATDNGSNFVCYFEQQSSAIQQAAAADGVTPQVLVGMDAVTYAYDPISDTEANESLETDNAGAFQAGTSCSFIPPSSYVDVYLADHYAYNATSNIAASPGERADNWQDWLACVLPRNKPIGLAEYGVNPNDSNPSGTASAIAATASYLAALPATTHEETAMWALWDSAPGTPTNWAIDDESDAISAWQAAETQNGGG
jgi:hypothetical protein